MDEQQASQQPESAQQPACPSCEEYLAGWKRAQADYQNVKKEMERERADMMSRANERLLERLLPVLDQFALAMQFLPDVEQLPEDVRPKWKNWVIGLAAIQTQWMQTAAAEGLEPIPTEGAFDPHLHEAVSEEASDTVGAGNIIRTMQTGWKLHGQVLRHARVVVAKT